MSGHREATTCSGVRCVSCCSRTLQVKYGMQRNAIRTEIRGTTNCQKMNGALTLGRVGVRVGVPQVGSSPPP